MKKSQLKSLNFNLQFKSSQIYYSKKNDIKKKLKKCEPSGLNGYLYHPHEHISNPFVSNIKRVTKKIIHTHVSCGDI